MAAARVQALLPPTGVPSRDAEAGIGRLVAFIPALYGTADFHDFGSEAPTGSGIIQDE